jgi:hypothetical protein
MNTNAYLSLAAAVMASLLLSSCASTQLSHTWRDASYAAGPMKTMLVVAVRKDQLRRRTWEDGFAGALARHGVEVTPSYRLFAGTLPDTDLISTTVRKGSFDGILLVGRASTTIAENPTAEVDISSTDLASHPWGEWYAAYYGREYYPGYPVMDEVVKDEIRVWTTQGGGRMIWSGVGEVHDSGAYEDVTGAIIGLIVPELVKQGVIAAGF